MQNSAIPKICLIADSAELFPEFHQNLLAVCRKCNFATQVVTSGVELLKQWVQQQTEYAAVFIDFELLQPLNEAEKEQVKERIRGLKTPVIGLGYHQEESVAAGKQYGIDNFLLKFQQPDQMIDLLKSLTYGGELNLRRHPRYLINLPATFQYEDQVYSVEIINASIGGLFLKSMFVMPLETELRIEFNLDDGGEDIVCVCQVRHSRAKQPEGASDFAAGMGVQFLQIEEADVKRFEKFLQGLIPISS